MHWARTESPWFEWIGIAHNWIGFTHSHHHQKKSLFRSTFSDVLHWQYKYQTKNTINIFLLLGIKDWDLTRLQFNIDWFSLTCYKWIPWTSRSHSGMRQIWLVGGTQAGIISLQQRVVEFDGNTCNATNLTPLIWQIFWFLWRAWSRSENTDMKASIPTPNKTSWVA